MPTMASSGCTSVLNESMPTTATRSQLPPRKPITLSVPRSGPVHMTKTSSGAQWAGERPKTDTLLGRAGQNTNILAQLQASVAAAKQNQAGQLNNSIGSSNSATANASAQNELDIALLREKSKHLDLPLISALCNDRSLLKQTKVLSNPKSPKTTVSNTATTSSTNLNTTATAATTADGGSTAINKSLTNLTHNNGSSTLGTSSTSNLSSPVTAPAVSTKSRKTSVSHRHPNDKLPPLPMQLAEANNYVMDPAILKHHKTYNSHT